MAQGPESRIQTWAIEYLRKNVPGIYVRKIHQSRFSRKAIPDLLVMYNGIYAGIEVKTENGVMSKLQLIEADEIIKAGGMHGVLVGKDKKMLDTFIRFITTHAVTPK